MEKTSIMCPSSVCKPGAQLLGIRQNDGTVAILPQSLPVDDSFVEKVKDGAMTAEQRFRFTNKCVEKGCGQWKGNHCGLVDNMIEELNNLPAIRAQEELPPCNIRPQCRWYLQRGAAACKICPYVIYKTTEQDILAMQFE